MLLSIVFYLFTEKYFALNDRILSVKILIEKFLKIS